MQKQAVETLNLQQRRQTLHQPTNGHNSRYLTSSRISWLALFIQYSLATPTDYACFTASNKREASRGQITAGDLIVEFFDS